MRLDVWYDSWRDRMRFTTVSFFTTLDPCMVPLLVGITRIVQKEVATDTPLLLATLQFFLAAASFQNNIQQEKRSCHYNSSSPRWYRLLSVDKVFI